MEEFGNMQFEIGGLCNGEDFDLGIVTVDFAGLHDFDVHSLCQSQIGEADVFDSDAEKNLGQADDEDSDHDDSEDNDFKEWETYGFEESDSFLLDEEDDLEPENESLNDIDLENDTQLRMTLGHSSIDNDVGENLLIVNKMAKHASSRWVESKLLDEFKDNPNMNKGAMQKTLMRRFGVAVLITLAGG
ncbi:hypothetical protein Cgig2_026666 [Carnegiea gigantea]|uniref:Uncharacterized protein n=1 Tax=Carnegiea gigantea TaxID=171969 RepID=A0A9Q1GKJ8_9CARY|nr:hypothetical protein Cgig2_026666 [Carnegiea gigantea]